MCITLLFYQGKKNPIWNGNVSHSYGKNFPVKWQKPSIEERCFPVRFVKFWIFHSCKCHRNNLKKCHDRKTAFIRLSLHQEVTKFIVIDPLQMNRKISRCGMDGKNMHGVTCAKWLLSQKPMSTGKLSFIIIEKEIYQYLFKVVSF